MQPRTSTGISNQDQLNKSFGQVLSGNVSPGNGLTFDANGQPLTYSPDNLVGCVIRVGSNANPNALANSWVGNNTNTTITHNLDKIPTGFVVLGKWAVADVFFGTIAATATTITLQTTNAATDITIWILC